MVLPADSSRLQNETTRQEEPRLLVHSEDHPDRMLLETRICREDGFQKQQGTYNWQRLDIIWTLTHSTRDPNSVDRTNEWN